MTNGLYVAMGDSITWTVAATAVYPTLTARSLRAQRGPFRYVNKGLGGSTTSEWKLVLNYMLAGLPIDLITIGLGMNDCAGSSDVAGYQANLRDIVDRLRIWNPDIEIILCAPSHTTDPNRTATIGAFRAGMAAVATERGTLYCDFSTAWPEGQTATYCADGIHPNDAGHALIHAVLMPVVQQTRFWQG